MQRLLQKIKIRLIQEKKDTEQSIKENPEHGFQQEYVKAYEEVIKKIDQDEIKQLDDLNGNFRTQTIILDEMIKFFEALDTLGVFDMFSRPVSRRRLREPAHGVPPGGVPLVSRELKRRRVMKREEQEQKEDPPEYREDREEREVSEESEDSDE